MNVNKIAEKITIRPTNKKMEKAQKVIDEFKALPKEMPLERDVFIKSDKDIYEEAKNRILISITNMEKGE